MKKLSILLLLLPLIIVGCKSNEEKTAELISNEEKAAELIKKELFKTLYDFDSYSPIETIVTEAKQSVYTDTAFWAKAKVVSYAFNLANKYLKDYEDVEERIQRLIGRRYSYSDSDEQYYELKKEEEEIKEKMATFFDLALSTAKSLKDTIQTVDTEKIVGWEVKHRFRCKTKGGHSTIGNYRYVMDENFKEILIFEDTDDEEFENMRIIVEAVISGAFE